MILETPSTDMDWEEMWQPVELLGTTPDTCRSYRQGSSRWLIQALVQLDRCGEGGLT